MPTLQTCPSAAALAVPDVPAAITATRQINAQVKARELIMIFVNFLFILVLSFRLSVVFLAFFWLLVIELSFLGPPIACAHYVGLWRMSRTYFTTTFFSV